MEIHHEILAAYGSHILSQPDVVKWYQQLKDGRTDLTNAERQRCPATVNISDVVQICTFMCSAR